MGQGAVRAAIYNALETASSTGVLPLVGTIYKSPTYITETDYEFDAVNKYTANINGSGCVIVIDMMGPDKRRSIALSGRQQVYDMNIHPIVLELYFASVSGDPLVAVEDYETIVDALIPFIRHNPTMSAPSTVWSAGEYRAGVTHECTKPFVNENGTTVFIVGTVTFDAWEQLIGSQ